jgi:hypothetical protein
MRLFSISPARTYVGRSSFLLRPKQGQVAPLQRRDRLDTASETGSFFPERSLARASYCQKRASVPFRLLKTPCRAGRAFSVLNLGTRFCVLQLEVTLLPSRF